MNIVITLIVTSNNRISDLHKFQNFAEDVFYWVRDDGWGDLDFEELDRGADAFAITGVKASKRRRIVNWVQQEAERQCVAISLDVQREDEAPSSRRP